MAFAAGLASGLALVSLRSPREHVPAAGATSPAMATGGEGLAATRQGCRVALHPPMTPYWRPRHNRYAKSRLVKLIRKHGADALTALDVGAYDPGLLAMLDWIPTKVATDKVHSAKQWVEEQLPVWKRTRGIAFIKGDLVDLDFAGLRYDLVICSQVVEHLHESFVRNFTRKLMSIAKVLIVATTFNVPDGTIPHLTSSPNDTTSDCDLTGCLGHVQDPISEAEFRSWFVSEQGRVVAYETEEHDRNVLTLFNKRVGVRVPVPVQVLVWKVNDEEH
eukprot:CAMPEP_0119095366 /NCGR_PEP_ID=MMETSP1178-20130426/169245_1 /TAXON_ID=33656 /ORGANISM="unid sp, Strain CCMP2000" /LENGTH=275 /DNA_ID=CAMNT_0007079165 /DNA_START=72 /DNA_END=899 /DNA_ORIENTATION=+